MSNKVSALGKAFGGVFAVLILVVWLTRSERQRDAELSLVHETAPTHAANEAFLRGERAFYLSWHTIRHSKETAGEWRLPGESAIPAAVLRLHPERIRLERSWHLELSDEAARFSREAWSWSEAYNRRLAELIVEQNPDRHGH